MIATPLAALVAADPLRAWQDAIVRRIAALLPGVRVIAHPGKIDISQMVAKIIVPAPGIAVGWTRVRSVGLIDGRVDITVDWAAYIVVEDAVIESTRVDRDQLGFAVGTRLLMILADPDETRWGLESVTPPVEQPAPVLVPLYTVSDQAKGTGYLAVSWSQTLIGQGQSQFDGDAPVAGTALDEDSRPTIDANFGADVPIDVRALWGDPA